MFNIGIWKFTKIGKAFKFLERKVDKQEAIEKKVRMDYTRKPNVTQEIQSKAFDLYNNGMSVREVASKLGYGRSTLQRAIKRESDIRAAKRYAKKKTVKPVSDPMDDRSKPIKFDPAARYESINFQNYSKQAAYERLIRAIEKRGGMALVTFPAHNMTRDQFRKSVNATLMNTAKSLKVKTSCRLAGNGLNEVLVEVK